MSAKLPCVVKNVADPRAAGAFRHRIGSLLLAGLALLAWSVPASGQGLGNQQVVLGETVQRLDMAVGRSIPMTTRDPIQRVSVANPSIADVVIITERELVLNALGSGVTDLLIWLTTGGKVHYRVSVHSPTDRQQVLLEVKIAEVDKSLLRELGVSLLFRDQHTRVGTNQFRADRFDDEGNIITDPIIFDDVGQFATVLSDNEIENLTALVDLNEQDGRFKTLAEPNLIAANGEEASFLAGGEIPIPIAQSGASATGAATITIQWKEFGIRLAFTPEILSEELIKLAIAPEASSLDFGNSIVISGFEVPALRTRRASTTLDMREGQTLAIAGLLQTQKETVHRGIPFLKDVPILGLLFSSKRWQNRETELLVLVTPWVIDPMSPPAPPPLPGEEQGN